MNKELREGIYKLLEEVELIPMSNCQSLFDYSIDGYGNDKQEVGEVLANKLQAFIRAEINVTLERVHHAIVKDYLEGTVIQDNPTRKKISERFKKIIKEVACEKILQSNQKNH
jgi:hypothetical protein